MKRHLDLDTKKKRQIAKRHLRDVWFGGKLQKPKGSVTLSATNEYILNFTALEEHRATGQRNATKVSADKRTKAKVAREESWRRMALQQLEKHPEWVTKQVVNYIQRQGFQHADRTIARVVAPLVKQHRKAMLAD